jgi:O-antigen/teichoic acid export membrane protein
MDNIKKQYKKLGENTLWMLVGNFATKLLSFFMVPLYTAYLSTADYGIADLMTTTVSFYYRRF